MKLHLELCEQRRLLAVDLNPAGVLTFSGTSKNDRILVFAEGATLVVDLNGVESRFARAAVVSAFGETFRGNDYVEISRRLDLGLQINAAAGADTLIGGGGNEVLMGESGNDQISAGAGDDFLDGGLGEDTLEGGDGDDQLNGFQGINRLTGGTGFDTVIYSWVEVTFAENSVGIGDSTRPLGLDLDRRRGDLLVYGQQHFDTVALDIEGVIGTKFRDRIVTSEVAMRIRGGGGPDTLFGGEGDDTILGEAGSDYIVGSYGHDNLRGGDGDDTIYGNGLRDTLNGEAGNDQLFGGSSSGDRIIGGEGDNDSAANDEKDSYSTVEVLLP